MCPCAGCLSSDSGSICIRLSQDAVYRRKMVLTAAVCGSYIALGWLVIQIGPCLPDLQLLARVDLETASWLMTTWSIGFTLGSLVAGVIFDRYNRLALMAASTLGSAICSACLPYAGNFSLMIVIRVLTGLFTGSLDTGANTIVPSIWGLESAPYVQALYFSYSIGGILSPLATEPFMVPRSNDTVGLEGQGQHLLSSITHHNTTFSQGNVTYTTVVENSDGITAASNIHMAFIVTAMLVLVSGIPYIVMLLTGGFEFKENFESETEIHVDNEKMSTVGDDEQYTECPKSSQCENKAAATKNLDESSAMLNEEQEADNTNSFLHGRRKVLVLAAVSGMNFMYCASENSTGDFLVTFCRDYLEWDNSPSVTLTSLYWVTSCVSGLLGVVLVRILGPARLLTGALLGWNISFLALLVAGLYRVDVLVWIALPVSGTVMVLIIPTAISWTARNVCPITGKVASLFLIATGLGLGVNPSFIGYMMEQYSYVYLFIILFTESLICSSLFVFARIVKCYFTRIMFKEKTQAHEINL